VLGKNFLCWCFPVNRNLKGDGLAFEIREDLKPKLDDAKPQEEEDPDQRKTAA